MKQAVLKHGEKQNLVLGAVSPLSPKTVFRYAVLKTVQYLIQLNQKL